MDMYFDISKHFDTRADTYMVISARGTGKTYSSLKWVIENNLKLIYLRNTEDEISISCNKLGNPFKKINSDLSTDYSFEKSGKMYELIKYTEDERMPMGLGVALSTAYKVRGADFSDIDCLLYDEFIPEESVKLRFNEATAFFNLYETISRNRELENRPPLLVIMLSNSNSISSRLLQEFGIVDSIEEMICSGIEKRTFSDKRLKVILPKMEYFSELKEKTALYQLSKNTAFSEMALNNKFADLSLANVVKKVSLNEYYALCNYEYMYVYAHKSRMEYYVTDSRADCQEYNADVKILFIRRWYPYKDYLIDGTFKYKTARIKRDFLNLFSI